MKNTIKLKSNINPKRPQSTSKITKYKPNEKENQDKLGITIEKIKSTKNLKEKNKNKNNPIKYFGEESDEEESYKEEEVKKILPIKSKKIESEYNPWNEEINFIQDTGNIKDFLDFCKVNSITKFNDGKKGIFLNDINEKSSQIKSPENLSYREKVNDGDLIKKKQIINADKNEKTNGKINLNENDENFICNYIGTQKNTIHEDEEKNKKNKAEMFLTNYSKYNKNQNFEVNDLNDEEKSYKKDIKSNGNKVLLNENKEEINNLFYGKNCFIDILEKLNDLSSKQYKKGLELEDIYEKYRFENLLSKEKMNFVVDTIINLNELFTKIEKSNIKISTLLHNNSLNDNTFVRIKHKRKFDFIYCMKLINSQIFNNENLHLITRSNNLSENTFKLIKNKFDYLAKEINNLCETKDIFN